MSTTSRIQFGYTDPNGSSKTISFNHADPDASKADVKALATALQTNGDIYMNPVNIVQNAKIITTDTTLIDLK